MTLHGRLLGKCLMGSCRVTASWKMGHSVRSWEALPRLACISFITMVNVTLSRLWCTLTNAQGAVSGWLALKALKNMPIGHGSRVGVPRLRSHDRTLMPTSIWFVKGRSPASCVPTLSKGMTLSLLTCVAIFML